MDAIEARGISKKFRIVTEPVHTLKDRVLHLRGQRHEDFWALKELDLSVPSGQTLGMLGHNGSGKSTLLKCIAGILLPTTGEVRVRGRIASLLELGAGFHPDLSGRENVFINASFLGISRKEVDKRLDEIIAFAGLEHFIDNQVKYYSSGMFVRLGFAVAVNVDPDILLVDEVLAVGDEVFQQKCLDRVAEFQAEGRTILFVTHGADLVRRICDRAIVLDHGNLVADGAPGEAIRIYREHLHGTLNEAAAPVAGEGHRHDPRIRITGVEVRHPGRPERTYLYANEPLTIAVHFEASAPVPDALASIEVFGHDRTVVFGADTDALGLDLPTLEGRGTIEFRVDSLPLLDGAYPVGIALKDRAHGQMLDWRPPEETSFEVVNRSRVVGRVALPMTATLIASSIPVAS